MEVASMTTDALRSPSLLEPSYWILLESPFHRSSGRARLGCEVDWKRVGTSNLKIFLSAKKVKDKTVLLCQAGSLIFNRNIVGLRKILRTRFQEVFLAKDLKLTTTSVMTFGSGLPGISPRDNVFNERIGKHLTKVLNGFH